MNRSGPRPLTPATPLIRAFANSKRLGWSAPNVANAVGP